MTIPAEVRRYLGIDGPGNVLVSIRSEDGVVEIRRSRYPDLRSLRGAAGSLDRVMSWDEMIAIAREDALMADPDES